MEDSHNKHTLAWWLTLKRDSAVVYDTVDGEYGLAGSERLGYILLDCCRRDRRFTSYRRYRSISCWLDRNLLPFRLRWF
ncbi:hypothetical protein L2E82_01075 [Cichorium intybus]|uniref:Uncharacterized protein n=1 Tax=Cichorium intybus TaxID=13427 RepID=A0ACB9GXZ2_CICIN|nr:hypothetical protein L2E82_01075 [Cichorium intybus]